ncbi:CotH kinase family protein [Flammeovirga yaeyamensis]|uniref:CotH kinase family protein n=1 Tax=Flammeovirga yaeyamensis TaxID=367791 RepID=A0AAX1NDI0_9BACT|nr:CotH kinase family protein [Flammeovirga yaeyamensis]MBB3697056.1 spore coat protein CotH [Flammeovirga yaeyamensis]NMF33718.1 T9SS type A sorting domain-containing protein [Flammeovirga yaeyamensis]QWG05016.1 CotH kinase family protein [Flammeovirga yaeyamensis]
MKNILLTLTFCVHFFVAFGQNVNPENGPLFPENEVNRVDITMDPADLAFLLAPGNEENREYKYCIFEFSNSQLTDSLHNVGIRLRGNTSRYAPKKSFKISFNKFIKGRQFHGEKKFNLRAEHNDPTHSREKSLLKFFIEEDIPSARSSHVALYINGNYHGVYLNTEQIDDLFLISRFGDDDGKLYKGNYGADLTNDPNLYMNDDIYEIEEGDEADRNELAAFLDSINILNGEAFSAYIERNFDVETYIKTLAIEHLSGHWDNYSYNKNNFLIYWDESKNLWTYLPYDLDNTYGIDWVGEDWGIRDLNDWIHPDQARPLAQKILDQPGYRNEYNEYLLSFIDKTFNNTHLDPYFNAQKALLRDYIDRDTYYTTNYGWTVTDYDKAFSAPLGGHVDYGISDFIETRVRYARQQIVITSIEDDLLNAHVTVYPNPTSDYLIVNMGEISYNRSIITLYNLNGQIVGRWGKKPTQGTRIPLDRIKSGNYILGIEYETAQGSWKSLMGKKVIIN